ncbi:hypothetical protein DKX38_000570 [Salix brachista]|uniref:RRM domain-containing protein n=1 Tax=Salix brachista TaxID=2182728 RepID=A0A5N5P3N5_9ROSI|nr:hypothetical protein DKX38_000570 [Salix brachista]
MDIDPDRIEIKSLRLPMKFGNHGGFAFVEHVTKQETQNALFSSTAPICMVLERAKEGESLEELRARMAAQFTEERHGFQKPTSQVIQKRKDVTNLDEESMKF